MSTNSEYQLDLTRDDPVMIRGWGIDLVKLKIYIAASKSLHQHWFFFFSRLIAGHAVAHLSDLDPFIHRCCRSTPCLLVPDPEFLHLRPLTGF
ncbi:MAG: hypothetical protein ACFFD4_04550 [Candidatus Odinarchaeota archaeon]